MQCPKCKTENGYARLETQDWVCRKCGKISKFIKILKREYKKEDDKNETNVHNTSHSNET